MLGKEDDAKLFSERAMSYKHLFRHLTSKSQQIG